MAIGRHRGAGDALGRAINRHIPIPSALRASLTAAIIEDLADSGFAVVRAEYARKRQVRRPSKTRCPAHLEWIRSLPCAVPGCATVPCEAAHVRQGTGGGMGLKPPDRFSAPLCREHHREQHQIGHRAFDQKYGVSLLALAGELAAQSPHLHAATAADRTPRSASCSLSPTARSPR